MNQKELVPQRHDSLVGARSRAAGSRWSLIGNQVSQANPIGSNSVGRSIPLNKLRLHQHNETYELAELDDLQDQVLRGIGRNVLNLQKMEGMLKFIVSSTGKIGSTKELTQPMKDLERSIKSRRKAIKRLPMGRLAETLSRTLRAKQDAHQKEADGTDRFSIKVSFSIEDENFTNELSQALGEIVRERNDLIHKKLIHLEFKSIESCRDLIRELDEQRARIKPQFETLSAICLSLKDYFKQLKDYADSESFVDDLKRAEKE